MNLAYVEFEFSGSERFEALVRLFDTLCDARLAGQCEDGEYELVDCRRVAWNVGRLEFVPFADSSGSVGSVKALLEAHGFKVIRNAG